MNSAFLLIGGNLGDRNENLAKARNFIEMTAGQIILQSSVYETAAWGFTDQPAFYNQALQIETSFSPSDLLQTILDIESKLGRIREEKMGPRLIDIDILFYNDAVIQLDNLEIPHPHMAKRRFVLLPLHEIAPHLQHPVSRKTITELLENCKDALPVKKLPDSASS